MQRMAGAILNDSVLLVLLRFRKKIFILKLYRGRIYIHTTMHTLCFSFAVIMSENFKPHIVSSPLIKL